MKIYISIFPKSKQDSTPFARALASAEISAEVEPLSASSSGSFPRRQSISELLPSASSSSLLQTNSQGSLFGVPPTHASTAAHGALSRGVEVVFSDHYGPIAKKVAVAVDTVWPRVSEELYLEKGDKVELYERLNPEFWAATNKGFNGVVAHSSLSISVSNFFYFFFFGVP
jgi:hypothetical protein